MIDAYEIGVQLALQDNVSAGLEVIGRELAQVDRAIAVTSAGLHALTQSAEAATRAVAAAAGVRAPSPTQATAVAERLPEPSPELPDQNAAGSASDTPLSSPASVTPFRNEEPAGKVEHPTAAPTASRPVAPPAPALEPSVTRTAPAPISSAPTPAASEAGVMSEQPRVAFFAAAAAPTQAALAEPTRAPTEQLRTRASVSQVVGPRARPIEASRAFRPANPASVTLASTAAPAAAAPAAGTERGMAAPIASAISARSSAPQPASKEQGGGNAGQVMLDGRLVGYWLSEQMAREASRPSGGTSFFDPRQTPAWTPSGAL